MSDSTHGHPNESTSPKRVPLPFGSKAVIGMVHLLPLPGSPRHTTPLNLDAVESAALRDTSALIAGGAGAIIVENLGDAPFHAEAVEPITIASMARIVRSIVEVASECGDVQIGVNVLRNDASSALSIAAATGARFIRVNVHTGAMLTDQGIIEGRAAYTIRQREALGCGPKGETPIAILADVGVKHAVAIDPSWNVGQQAEDAWRRGGADALVISGASTGAPTSPKTLSEVRVAVPNAPVIIGSGMTIESMSGPLNEADGWIVGTALRTGGLGTAIDVDMVLAMVAASPSRS